MEKLLNMLEKLIETALDELYEKDQYLLEHDAHERTIVFRFGHYLQNLMDNIGEFQTFNLDFEYNRNGQDPKRIPGNPRNGILPDLVIHQRGSNKYNLIVLEFKTPWNVNVEDDCEKLRQLVDMNGAYGYLSGKSILLGMTREDVTVKIFLRQNIGEA